MTLTASTAAGPVEGRERKGVLLFAGIPYAAPPLGSLRFAPPQKPEPWTSVRSAKRFGPAAPQRPTGSLTSKHAVRWSEDCLTLNVATPALDGGRRPVLVWIHGGAYRTGQGAIPWYDGSSFARHGVVVVSLNYRLGALGFSHLARHGADFSTSGVNGLLDQLAALGWVRDNIERFGGDPERVTVAGESAGAFSVSSLLASPGSEGLFRAAIAQSGAGHQTLPIEAAEKVADRLCELLALKRTEDLYSVDVETILDAQAKIDLELAPRVDHLPLGVPVQPFYPVVEGTVLPQSPIEAFRSGGSASVPLLTGTNSDETTLWFGGDISPDQSASFARRVGRPGLCEAYRSLRPDATDRERYIALTSDHDFRLPAVRMAEAREEHGASTWMYLFRWQSRAFGGRLGATHALEIPFVFDTLDRPGVDVFLGDGPLPQGVADQMHACWCAFVHTSDPRCESVPEWPTYSRDQRATLVFDEESRLAHDPDGDLRELWEGLR